MTAALVLEAFERAAMAAKRYLSRARRLPLIEHHITLAGEVVSPQSADGRVHYELQRHGKQIELRRVPAEVRGKANVKAAKRARQKARPIWKNRKNDSD